MRAVRRSCVLGTVLLFALAEPQRADTRPVGQPTRDAGISQRGGNTVSLAPLRTAIERAARYLGTQEHHGPGAWFTTQAAILLGAQFKVWAGTLKLAPSLREFAKSGSPKTFPEAVEAGIWSRRWMRERPAVHLPKPDTTPLGRAESRRFEDPDEIAILAIQLVSLNCRRLSPENREHWLIMLSAPTHNYLLTNELLTLLLAYNQGCLSPRVVTPIRLQLATQIFAELIGDSDTLDALAIERLATLCYAGVCDWIAPELITRLINEQQPWGTWGVRDPHLFRGFHQTEEQTAAFAFYVLARTWAEHHGSAPGPKPPPMSTPPAIKKQSAVR